MPYIFLANLLAILHTIFVVILVISFPFVLTGNLRKNRTFEGLFLFVAISTALSFAIFKSCILTGVEKSLRVLGGQQAYTGGFISHTLSKINIHVTDISVLWFLTSIITLSILAEIYWNRKALLNLLKS